MPEPSCISTTKKKKFDYLICEGGYYRNFFDMSRYFGTEKMLCHLHSEFVPESHIRKSFSGYIAISQFIKDKWDARLNQQETPTYVLRNCININKFLEKKDALDVRKKYNIAEDAYLITYVGRIIPVKGVEQLVNAFLKCSIPNKHLMLIGSTNFGSKEISGFEARMRKKIKKHSDIVTVTGFVSNNLLSAYLSKSNLIVMPSLCQEGAGLVAIEALSTGVNFLVTESGGINEFAKDGYCYKISKDEYFKQNTTTNIEDYHVLETDWSQFEDKLSQVIDDIATGKLVKTKSAFEYISEFDSTQYYNNFHQIMQTIDNDRGK